MSARIAPLLLITLTAPLGAQYFGQNKVQYEKLDWKVLRTDRFDVHYGERTGEAGRMAARLAERWRVRLDDLLRHQLSGRQPVIFYPAAPQFQQTNVIAGEIGEGTGGVTEAARRRVIMPFAGPLAQTDHVLGHELVHAYQYDMTGGAGLAVQGVPGAATLPLWFIEGMAEYLSLGPEDPHTAMWLRDAVRRKLPTVEDLSSGRFFPYRYGQALVGYIAGRWGEEAVRNLLVEGARRRDIGTAIREVLNLSPEALDTAWHQALRDAYGGLLRRTDSASRYGARLVEGNDQNAFNLAPALSPDGRHIMYLSDRSLFSIELFLADAQTGAVRRKITETALDPHLQSLQFINSAGAWDRSGERFAFAGLSGGRPTLEIYDLARERVTRSVRLEQIDEVYSPSWSPDGKSIVFSGLAGGLLDLYILETESGATRRLTNDPYSALQPAWSPDGRLIAFATDRFTTELGSLQAGVPVLAFFDLETGGVRRAVTMSGKQINPQWSADGRSLYFIGDGGGISNVYRLEVGSGAVNAVTNVFTGVSGITALSPALSVAQNAEVMVFSLFENGGYSLYRVDDPAVLRGNVSLATGAAGVLPPAGGRRDRVQAVLSDSRGLPADREFTVEDYRAGLGLEYVGQPTIAFGADRFGTHLGGGIAFGFADLLGNHNVVTGVQLNGSLRDLAAVAAYQNLGSRLNWGLGVQQVPYLTGSYAAGLLGSGADRRYVEQLNLQRQTNRSATLFTAYPFNRFQRFELSATGTLIGFDREIRTRFFNPVTGEFLREERQDLEAPESLTLGQGSAALVYDNAILGWTSPIRGQRYRLEANPVIGTLNLFQGLADYRQYFYLGRPFTLAFRLMHFGRYGSDAEDSRLSPLFLGWDGLVRGYSLGSFSAAECPASVGTTGSCPVFDQLVGSRILVGNAELRFPLLGLLNPGGGYYGGLPLEIAFFGDAGVAWDSSVKPALFGGERKLVKSVGVAARFNAFGVAVLQVDFSRPFDRPGKGWVWQFSLQPGF